MQTNILTAYMYELKAGLYIAEPAISSNNILLIINNDIANVTHETPDDEIVLRWMWMAHEKPKIKLHKIYENKRASLRGVNQKWQFQKIS